MQHDSICYTTFQSFFFKINTKHYTKKNRKYNSDENLGYLFVMQIMSTSK